MKNNTLFLFNTKKIDRSFSRWCGYGYKLKDYCQTNNLHEWENFINKYRNYPTFGFIPYELLYNFYEYKSNKTQNDKHSKLWWGIFENSYLFDKVSNKYLHKTNMENSQAQSLNSQLYFKVVSNLKPNISPQNYISKVKTIKRQIEMGNVYQVNLSFRIDSQFEGNPYCVYKYFDSKLSLPYSIFFHTDNFSFIAFSPELLLFKNGNKIYTRPIKGTLKKDGNSLKNAKDYFKKSIKDNRELDMIIDVERNDFHRICYPDSVKVVDKSIEEFPNLYHLVGTIEGQLRKNISLSETIEYTFPSSSVTGAPKISAVKIISQIEPHERFIYTGGIGFNYKNTFLLAMGIRIMVFHKDNLHIYTGSGITHLSNPQKELKECEVKINNYKTILENFR